MPEAKPPLDAVQRANFGHTLFRAARLFNEAAIAKIQVKHPQFRLAHTQLLPHLNGTGVRPSVVAEKVGISKQAVGVLLADMVSFGALEQLPDPKDRRAKLVRLTPLGYDAIREGLGVLMALGSDVEAAIGRETMARLQADLTVLLSALERRALAEGGA